MADDMQSGVKYSRKEEGRKEREEMIGLFEGWEKEHHFEIFAILVFFAEQICSYRRCVTT